MSEAPLLAFYGDDFTGSTDALESAALAGARAALFVDLPTPAAMARHPGLQVVGVAGTSRALAPAPMEAELRPAFAALRALGAPHLHYKLCSTFDSSPAIGSIGRAIELGMEVCGSSPVPLLVGAPALGRFCVFGDLFARMGTGSSGPVHRLDRHPSMIRHPVTPADESDLRRHLARQTRRRTGLFDILQVALPPEARRAAFAARLAEGWDIVLMDVLYPEQLEALGELIDSLARPGRTLFCAGSSSVEAALGLAWSARGLASPPSRWPDPGPASPVLAASGSCSPVTERQIARALDAGFAEVALDAARLMAGAGAEEGPVLAAAAEAARLLGAGRSVIVHTCRGGADPRLAAGERALRDRDPSCGEGCAVGGPGTARILGTALGRIVRLAAAEARPRRVVVAGGDTSSYAARAMGIEVLEMVAPLFPGAPLCRADAPGSPLDGLEVNFKGGQIGGEDYFSFITQLHP